MCTETLCIEEAIERPKVFEPSRGRLEKGHSAEGDVRAPAKPELIFVDCAGLCEE
jgi:hypothetical protein